MNKIRMTLVTVVVAIMAGALGCEHGGDLHLLGSRPKQQGSEDPELARLRAMQMVRVLNYFASDGTTHLETPVSDEKLPGEVETIVGAVCLASQGGCPDTEASCEVQECLARGDLCVANTLLDIAGIRASPVRLTVVNSSLDFAVPARWRPLTRRSPDWQLIAQATP
jgi:hypothetical protein